MSGYVASANMFKPCSSSTNPINPLAILRSRSSGLVIGPVAPHLGDRNELDKLFDTILGHAKTDGRQTA